MQDENILVWLPSPIGDAILCTPALRALRQLFKTQQIYFLAKPIVREVLSPCTFNDIWLEQSKSNPFVIATKLRKYKFRHAILFKNSFGSALTTFLAGIPSRIGYAREVRAPLLSSKLYPPRLPNGSFKPISMIDYYLAIASWLGADTANRELELLVEQESRETLKAKLPEASQPKGPIVTIVPGGAFGPSKCWPSERFAQTADWLITNYKAIIFISVSPAAAERQIAKEICDSSRYKLINLAERSISLGELKSLFSIAELVISNDTGPRHIAIALKRKLISLFGPNDPAWTDTGYENEIKIVGNAPCTACGRPICKEREHLCMEAITVQMVCDAAKKLLENTQGQSHSQLRQNFVEISKSFFVDEDFKEAFCKMDLTSIDTVFSFDAGKNLTKDNLSKHRSRLKFEIDSLCGQSSKKDNQQSQSPSKLFLKRYDRPPISLQLRNWLSHRCRISCGFLDFEPSTKLSKAGINTPKPVAYGQDWGYLFEKRSFCITAGIPNAQSLEEKLPDCFRQPATVENLRLRRSFIRQLAAFIKKFHDTHYCHRDLYLSHIFYSNSGQFYLIDLARVFKPAFFAERFRIKDIAQIHYSAPGKHFSKTDRLRFYLVLSGHNRLTRKDKIFIRKVKNKAKRMAQHDIKHGRDVPFID